MMALMFCALGVARESKGIATPTAPKVASPSRPIVAHPLPPKPVADRPARITGVDIPIEQWIGRKFVYLRMPKLFRRFGYELYSSAKLKKETAPQKAELETKDHRLIYERFVGKTLTVQSVAKVDSEYLVTFTDDSTGMPVFGRTHVGALQGIAFYDDMAAAAKQWMGSQIYSRKRFVSTFDSVRSTVGSFKGEIQTPLKVTGIEWGLSPMPPQPLWLMVEAPDGSRGFIGTFFSWTNVMTDLRRPYAPYTEDLFTENPQETWNWPAEIWSQINTHNVVEGMTRNQVLMAWNNPMKQDSVVEGTGKQERWAFQGQFLHFDKGLLVRIENR